MRDRLNLNPALLGRAQLAPVHTGAGGFGVKKVENSCNRIVQTSLVGKARWMQPHHKIEGESQDDNEQQHANRCNEKDIGAN